MFHRQPKVRRSVRREARRAERGEQFGTGRNF